METYITRFLMAAVLFGCCYILNIKAGSNFIATTSLMGIFASIGFMFYTLYSAVA